MTGNEWLDYFSSQQPKGRMADWLDTLGTGAGAALGFALGGPPGMAAGASLGGAVGGLGEDVVNKTATPGSAVGAATRAVGGYGGVKSAADMAKMRKLLEYIGGMPPIPLADGGTVPDPERLLELLNGGGPLMDEEPRPEPLPMLEAKHPGWEALAAVLGPVLSSLPPPRAGVLGQNQTNKTIGAYMPAAGVGLSALAAHVGGKREAENNRRTAQNIAAEQAWQTGAREMSRRRWDLARERMKGEDAGLTPEQFDKLGVPKEFRSKAGYDAWVKQNQRSDQNLNRLQIRAAGTKDIAQFPEIRDAYNKIGASAAGGTGVSDMALVFSFMRVLDPTSVVREGEYERAIKTEGIPGWLWATVQRVQNGALLTKQQRERMVSEAKTYFEQKRGAYRRARQWVDRIAKYYGLDPELALPNLEAPDVYIGVSPAEPEGAPGGSVDDMGVPMPKLKEATR